tara:strand:+ start:5973 stop:7946 length:1974 start_codon:yes stop_codon:yes gene_type:complete
MPIRWETFPVELTGGLVSNLSRLQHGLKLPGSARVLQNFEPSTQGGYRRISGFNKFDTAVVPAYGSVVVQGSAQTGTTLLVADTHEAPVVNDTFTLAGVTGTYTVTAVAYNSTNKSATLTITPALDSSPADKAVVTFTLGQSRIEGVHYSEADSGAYVLRGGTVWRSVSAGWTKVSTPSYGSPLVAGGSQAGSSLDVDAIASDTYVPQAGDTFSIDGVELVYTVTAIPTVTSGVATLAISPALDTSPADNAAVTFLSSSHTGGVTARFRQFNFDGSLKTAMVDSSGKPAIFTSTTYKTLQGVADVVGAQFVEEFKDHLFFAKNDLVSHTAPFDEGDFQPGNGAGSYRLPGPCTGLITFREQLVNFSQTDIRKLTGTSLADFALTSVTNDIGCIAGDTVKEVGGDVLFLGPDGIRFLGATERIGDFNLSLASRQIQEDFTKFIKPGTTYTTSVFREKNQYRIFKYKETTSKSNSEGFLGTQFLDQNAQSISWATTKGIKAYRTSSSYVGDTEVSLFSNDDEYIYRMDSGSTFDGVAVPSLLYTPFMAINDPSIRKTAYKLDTFFEPEGTVTGTLTLRYDFNKPNKIQPAAVPIIGGGLFSLYGEAIYGEAIYGGDPDTFLANQVVGSFFTVSLQYEFEGGAPFVLDTAILEYSTSDRK